MKIFLLYDSFLCMYACVCCMDMSVWVYVVIHMVGCVWVCMHVEARGQHQLSSSVYLHLHQISQTQCLSLI